jgi:hypothetical protein
MEEAIRLPRLWRQRNIKTRPRDNRLLARVHTLREQSEVALGNNIIIKWADHVQGMEYARTPTPFSTENPDGK